MATLQDLNRRIKSVSNTRKITKAMEMVAAAKLRRAQVRIENLRPFASSMVEITAQVASGIHSAAPIPLLEERDPDNVCLVVFTGDRGLAGALNANILRRSLNLAREWEGRGSTVHWLGVGKKGVASLQFRGIEVERAWRGITDAPKFRDAEDIARHIIDRFEARAYDKVMLVYNNFESAMAQRVIVRDLLPLTDELVGISLSEIEWEQPVAGAVPGTDAGEPGSLSTHSMGGSFTGKGVPEPNFEGVTETRSERPASTERSPESDWFFEPDTQSLLDRLLPTYVEQAIFRGLLESTASEHGARMTAMRNASENAGDLIDRLTLERNRARQAEITQEILEVVGGAEALS